MHIFLYGPVGAGKSTVGRILARQLCLPFVDVDRVIETNAGRTIFEIITQEGEAACRELETTALQQLVGNPESVIALGGGALLREENRSLVEAHGSVIFLAAEFNTLLERLSADANQRPLLAGDLGQKLESLLTKRREHYASFPLRLEASETPEELSNQIQMALGRFHLSAMGDYDVIVDQVEQITNLSDTLQSSLIVTDENVAKFHLERVSSILQKSGLDPKSVILPAGEELKNLDTVSHLWNAFLENGLDRKSTVIALGGGVIGDLAGFTASTYMRGIPWICVPTTLLSMVDASMGGKTGFDLPQGKNLIGSFHPPRLVLADPQFLITLPEREFISGLAEVVKHGIISDPDLFNMCAQGPGYVRANLLQIVKRAMAVKIKVIEEDPYEKGLRAALNLGHTVGHAVELVSQFKLHHGEAIAIGMVVEARFAERKGIAPPGLCNRIASVLSGLGLPVEIPAELPRADILQAIRMDKKKNAAGVRFALPAAIGKVELVEVTGLESVLEI